MRDLDELTGGWQPGNLVVLASRPGMGKSSVALNFATHAAFKERAAVLFCSLEMSTSETVQRHLATETNISTDRLRRGLAQHDLAGISLAAAERAAPRRGAARRGPL